MFIRRGRGRGSWLNCIKINQKGWEEKTTGQPYKKQRKDKPGIKLKDIAKIGPEYTIDRPKT